MRRSTNVLLTLFLLLSFTPALVAQAGYKLKTRSASELASEQKRAVSSWCRLDYEGLRLNEASWRQRMRPLTTEKSYTEFPSIYIVSRYQFDPQEGISTALSVSYTTVGRYDLAFGYTPEAGQDTVTYRVEDKGGEILITDTGSPLPHVSKPAAIRWLKERLQQTASENEKAQLQEALKSLEPASATESPSAPK